MFVARTYRQCFNWNATSLGSVCVKAGAGTQQSRNVTDWLPEDKAKTEILISVN